MKNCNGICVFATDLGLPEFESGWPAYPHPACPEHGAGDEEDIPLTPEEEEELGA